jgi:hypothetical protein
LKPVAVTIKKGAVIEWRIMGEGDEPIRHIMLKQNSRFNYHKPSKKSFCKEKK